MCNLPTPLTWAKNEAINFSTSFDQPIIAMWTMDSHKKHTRKNIATLHCTGQHALLISLHRRLS